MMIPKLCGKKLRWQIGARLATRKRQPRCPEIGQVPQEIA